MLKGKYKENKKACLMVDPGDLQYGGGMQEDMTQIQKGTSLTD